MKSAAMTTGAARVQPVCDHIARHHRERLHLHDLADRAGLSPFHFIRVFRATTGITPHQYVRRCRLERARELLVNTALPVTEICHRVGFASVGSFSRTFRAATGESPLLYRKRHRQTPCIPACFLRMYRADR